MNGSALPRKDCYFLHVSRRYYGKNNNPFAATRYHSLIVERESLPDCLEVTAWTEEGEIMGLRHKEYPIEGVQYHPESIMTEDGKQLLKEFILLYCKG